MRKTTSLVLVMIYDGFDLKTRLQLVWRFRQVWPMMQMQTETEVAFLIPPSLAENVVRLVQPRAGELVNIDHLAAAAVRKDLKDLRADSECCPVVFCKL